MSEGLLDRHLEFCFYNLAPGLVQVAMGKSVSGIISNHGLPLILCQDFDLYCKPADLSSGNPELSTHARVNIQLTLILDLSQRCCLLFCNESSRKVFFTPKLVGIKRG